MILDAQNRFSAAQAIVALGNTLSTNVIDLGPQHNNISAGGDPDGEIYFAINQTFTSGGAGTLQMQIVSADDAAIATNVVVHESSDVFALAALTAGSRLPYQPRMPISPKRYLAVRYVVGVAAMTAGQITAVVATARQSNR